MILNSVISQFDFTYCLTVNILTYIIINIGTDDIKFDTDIDWDDLIDDIELDDII